MPRRAVGYLAAQLPEDRPASAAVSNRPTRDPGDDYDEVLEFYLNDLVAHGWITGWSPCMGDSILLRGPSAFGSGLLLSYASALDYAAGYFDAMHHAHKISYNARGCDVFPDGAPEYDTDEIIRSATKKD